MKPSEKRLDELAKRARNLAIVARRVHLDLHDIVAKAGEIDQAKYDLLHDQLDVVNAHVILVRSKLRSLKP